MSLIWARVKPLVKWVVGLLVLLGVVRLLGGPMTWRVLAALVLAGYLALLAFRYTGRRLG